MAISSSTAPPSVSLSNPYSLLPFFGAEHASQLSAQHCYGSQVQQQTSPSKKRKRSEFAIAVDGHGVSVIDVQAPRIISTYSAPPTTRFTCSPLSIKYPNGPTRWTYVSMSSENRSLSAWKEQAIRRSSRTNSAVSSPASEFGPLDTSIEHHSRPATGSSNILALHNLAHGNKASGELSFDDVLVVFEDSSLQCLSADLQVERWVVNSRNTPSHRTRGPLLLSSIISINTAKKTLLKNRLEVLAGYQAKPGDCVLTLLSGMRRKENVDANIYLISNSSAVGQVRKLAQTRLAVTGLVEKSQFTFHPSTGKVFRCEGQSVTAYDLSQLAPNPETLLAANSPIASILPTSSSNLFVSMAASISVYNTKYGATHFTLPTSIKPGLDQSVEPALYSSLVFLGYITEIDVGVGFNKHGCFAIQLTKSGLFTGDTILDSLCKGVKSVDLDEDIEVSKSRFTLVEAIQIAKEPDHSKERRARAVLKILAELAAEGDAFGFEKEFAEFVGLDRKTGAHAITNGVSTNGLDHTNGDHRELASTQLNGINGVDGPSPATSKDEDLPEFLYPPPEEGQFVEPQLERLTQSFVAAVLGTVFKPVFTDSGALELELTMFVPNVFKFLLWEGYFSCTNLPAQGSGLVNTLVKFDPEFTLLLFFLENASTAAIPLKEVVTSVKVIMADLVRGAGASPVAEPDDDMDLTEDTLDDEQLQRVTRQVEQALEQAQQLLDLSDVKERILRAALLRVGRFSRPAIIRALRETLDGAELAGLIRVLRRELLRDIDERELAGQQDEADNLQDEEWLGLICDLLTSAVDAAGMTGLLLAKDTLVPFGGAEVAKLGAADSSGDEAGDVDREELLLESLSTEVAATCESLEGASLVSEALSHFLSRAQAYSAAMTRSSAHRRGNAAPGAIRPRRQRKPEIMTREKKKAAVLPMGYPPPIHRNKKADEVGQKSRQVRVNKHRKNLGVGAYSLERIEI
ncbi:hypothetical protein DRE_01839 [Drechslerella stenobrocha 248]|uniref:Utp8 beta-propeller domain-containing protein n=1 Tax=Drechslerella stenobrocha 248 TaxID=1043628 RepID=W7I968_9PEZI|nr:hypothetical protein DRE_01839 [Drechslerella stenobrocha 248]